MNFKRILTLLLFILLLEGCVPKSFTSAFNVDEQLIKAETLFAQGNYEETILTLETVLEVEPTNAKGYLRLSDVYIAKGEREKALQLLQKGLDLTEDAEIAQRIRGMTQVVDGIVDVAGGEEHALLLNDKGEVYWCGNMVKQISNIRYSDYALTPKKVEGLSNVRSIGVGYKGYYGGSIDFAITGSNTLYLWGEHSSRYFTWEHDPNFPTVLMQDVQSAVSTDDNLYVIETDGSLYALGRNNDGQRGAGEQYVEEYHSNPEAWDGSVNESQAVRVMDHVQKVVSGYASYESSQIGHFQGSLAFALDEDGRVFGWGVFGTHEENGRIVKTCFNTPRELRQDIVDMDLDSSKLYVITKDGKLLYATLESVGTGMPDWTQINCGSVPMISVYCGNSHYIAVNMLGETFCGGSNYYGELGMSTEEAASVSSESPVRPLGEARVRLAVAGEYASYAITPEGLLLCWGNNDEGQLGNGRRGTQKNAEEPIFVMPGVEKVFASIGTAYFLLENADLYIAGYIKTVTPGKVEEAYTPVKVLENVAIVDAESGSIVKKDHTLWLPTGDGYEKKMDDVIFYTSMYWSDDENHLVIRSDNSLWGWGDNYCGELGLGWLNDIGTVESRPVTEPVKIMENVKQVSFSSYPPSYNRGSTTYILTLDGKLYFCGYNIAASNRGNTLEGSNEDVFQITPKLINEDVAFVFGHRGNNGVYYIKENGRMYFQGWNYASLYYSSDEYYFGEKPSVRSGVAKANESILLDENGKCYLFGGQVMVRLLGLDPDTWTEKARAYGEGQLICELMLEDVKDIACDWGGDDVSYYAVKTNGDLYAWGNNLSGQLGLGEAGAQENIYTVSQP